jgi:hypothetical protein
MILMIIWFSASNYLMMFYEHMPNEKIQSYLLRVSRISAHNEISLNIFSINNFVYFLCLIVVFMATRSLSFSAGELALIKYTQYSNVLGFFIFYIFDAIPVVAFRLPEILRVAYPLVLTLVAVRVIKFRRDGVIYILAISLLSALMCFITIRAVATIYS